MDDSSSRAKVSDLEGIIERDIEDSDEEGSVAIGEEGDSA